MSWERTELDWLIERWETEATPWSRPTLLEWLRYVEGRIVQGQRYFVPERCVPQIREAAWAGRPPGRRAVAAVAGWAVEDARRMLARPELWQDPRDTLIRKLRAEIAMQLPAASLTAAQTATRASFPVTRPERVCVRQKGRVASEGLRRAVFERDRHTCVYCGATGRTAALVADHFIPWSKGGPTTLDNLVTACVPCNSRKGDKMPTVSP